MKDVRLVIELSVEDEVDVHSLVVGHHETLDGITIYPEVQGDSGNLIHSAQITERYNGRQKASMKRGREKRGTLGC